MVLLFPGGSDQAASARYYAAEVDQSGRWEIKNVLPGAYQAVAVDNLVLQNSTDPLLRQMLLKRGAKPAEVKRETGGSVDDLVVLRVTE